MTVIFLSFLIITFLFFIYSCLCLSIAIQTLLLLKHVIFLKEVLHKINKQKPIEKKYKILILFFFYLVLWLFSANIILSRFMILTKYIRHQNTQNSLIHDEWRWWWLSILYMRGSKRKLEKWKSAIKYTFYTHWFASFFFQVENANKKKSCLTKLLL